jgi:hypothetical protein
VKKNKVKSREAATAIGRAKCAAAASRLKIIFCLSTVGLRPRLHAAIASRFLKCATSKSVSEGLIYSLAYASGYDRTFDSEILRRRFPVVLMDFLVFYSGKNLLGLVRLLFRAMIFQVLLDLLVGPSSGPSQWPRTTSAEN